MDKQQPEDLTAFCWSDTVEPQVPALAILRMLPQLTPELVYSYEHPRLITDNELPFKGRVLNLISKLRVTPGCHYRNRFLSQYPEASLHTHALDCVECMCASSSCLQPLTPVCRCASRFTSGGWAASPAVANSMLKLARPPQGLSRTGGPWSARLFLARFPFVYVLCFEELETVLPFVLMTFCISLFAPVFEQKEEKKKGFSFSSPSSCGR